MLKNKTAVFLLCILLSHIFLAGPLDAQMPFFGGFFKKTVRQYFIKTADGWTLSLKRYPPVNIKRHGAPREPVVLCHGFNYNSSLWDLDEKHSLARYLQGKGCDVWAVDLRGSGDSTKPALSDLRSLAKLKIEKFPQILIRAPMNVARFDWTIDDHIHRDLPAIIEFVKNQTGERKINWIGHSMGGIVMYGYLETKGGGDIKNFAAVGTMVNVPQPPNDFLKLISSQKPLTDASLLVNTTVAYQLRNLTLGSVKLPWEKLFYNEENMDELTAMRMFRTAIDDTAPGVIAQFSEAIRSGVIMSVDKKFDYTRNLNLVKTPILIIGGAKDMLASAETIRYASDNVSSDDKETVIFSKANGYSADYGHCDLILGKKSEEEVYSYIWRWLEKR